MRKPSRLALDRRTDRPRRRISLFAQMMDKRALECDVIRDIRHYGMTIIRPDGRTSATQNVQNNILATTRLGDVRVKIEFRTALVTLTRLWRCP